MAGLMEYESLLDTAQVCDGFQRVIQFAVAVHRQQFSFRCGIPVLFKDIERNIQQWDLIADFCFLAGGLNPQSAVLDSHEVFIRQAAHIPVWNAGKAGEKEQVADMVEFPVMEWR